MGVGFGKYQTLAGAWEFEMPKTSRYAVALGLNGQSCPATRNEDRPDRAVVPPNSSDRFYFELETLLDNWRRDGIAEDIVRSALNRANRTSLAMEDFGKWLKGKRI